MPIQNKDLGKYNRPAIFIEETDASIIELPVQDVLINLIPGFSKKGPINKPVYITNKGDFTRIFGDIDPSLERKGAFFHRTCLKMLESGPIWALNLLLTNDSRDTVNWKSISVSSYYDNAATKTIPYSRLFNRQDFWERDDETFLDYVNDPTPDTTKLLHLTNMGNKTITVFMFKSSVEGFDVTAENWYGGKTKIPAYVHETDWISDFMMTTLVLEGDWTDYNTLSVDTTWSKYFNTSGLIKTTITDFVNEPNVNVLYNTDSSLLPYFKDLNNRDMYIKTNINNETDTTGLFCSYNESLLLDSDYPTGKIDLIGDSLVGAEKTSLDFISYNEDIVESKSYNETNLNAIGNVFGNYSTVLEDSFAAGISSREGNYTNGYIHEATIGSTGSSLLQVNDIVLSGGSYWLDIALDGGLPNGIPAPHDTPVVGDIVYFNVNIDSGTVLANTPYYIIGVEQSGNQIQISETESGQAIEFTTTGTLTNTYLQRAKISLSNVTSNSYFNVSNSSYTFNSASTDVIFEPLEFSTVGVSYERYDLLYLSKEDNATVNIFKGTQSDTLSAVKPSFTNDMDDYILLGYAHLTISSGVTATASTSHVVNVDYTPVSLDTTGYLPLTNITCTGLTIGSSNYVQITFVGTSGTTDYTDYNKLRYRQKYTEIESALDDLKGVIINKTTGEKYPIESLTAFDYSTSTDGILRINVGSNSATDYFNTTDTYKFLLYYIDNEFLLSDVSTDRFITTNVALENLTTSGQSDAAGVIGKYSNLYLDYYNGIINNYDYAYVDNISGSTSDKIYLKMWLEDEVLYVDLVSDTTGISPMAITDWSTSYSSNLIVWSNNSNYKQTLEIESFDTTKYPNLVTEISVDKTRYSEIIKGNFLEAYYDETEYAIGGSKYGQDPKKLVRVVSATLSSTNSSLKVLKTDGPIKITRISKVGSTGYDYYTTVYPQIDTYVSTYKGIKLDPFTISADSIPNGTETRQSSILDLIDTTTNLGKGLFNKNKISWRYLVDSFGNGLTNESKQQYLNLCGKKLNSLGFINMPSVKSLKASTDPYFINDDRTLNITYLKNGGDETRNPSFLYSFGSGVGRSCVGYFFPYVRINDNGIPKNVPPAAFAATTYMNKFLTSQAGIEPWTIAAGIEDGRILGIGGAEMEFTNDDLSDLYKMGANAITKKNNIWCIDNESTAQVFPYSSLSLMHSREVLIELENSLYEMLLRYQWKFNTPEIRAEIKYKADKICKDFKNRNALYDFRNVMDSSNNTNYIIDLQIGVLDTYVELIKGMGIIVNNITILKKGAIESGGFL